MTLLEVHRFLYGNDRDEDDIVPGEGILGILKQYLGGVAMSIVYSDETMSEDESYIKKNYSCVLPYFFINFLANNVLEAELTEYRVEMVFDEVCVIESNDHSVAYVGTFYELLMKVAQFTEIYYTDLTSTPSQWRIVSTSPREPRLGVECGNYDGRELFFDDMNLTDETAMTVFAPIEESSYEYQEIDGIPTNAFEMEVLYPEFYNTNLLCNSENYGVEAYGVESTMPEDVLGPGAAISVYEISHAHEEDTSDTLKALVSALSDDSGNYCFRERTQADVSDNHQISCESLYGITVDIDNVVVLTNHSMELQVYYEGGDTTIEATLAMNYNGPGTKYVFYGLQSFGEKHSGERFLPYLHLIITDLTAGKVLREITATSGDLPQ